MKNVNGGPYSVGLKHRLTGALFDVDRSGPAVRYRVRPGSAADAAATWAVHGICTACSTCSIMVGRCVECGKVYSDPSVRGVEAERMVAEQCRRAESIVRVKERTPPSAESRITPT